MKNAQKRDGFSRWKRVSAFRRDYVRSVLRLKAADYRHHYYDEKMAKAFEAAENLLYKIGEK